MRAGLLLAGFFVGTVGCTAYVVGELSGLGNGNGNEGGTPDAAGDSPGLGGCFQLASNTCGQCIVGACEKPNGNPPVSLAQVCTFQASELPNDVMSCVSFPDIQNDSCQTVMQEGGAYSPDISTQAAAENNLRKCIFDNCVTSCSQCNVEVPSCNSTTVNLAEAGTPCSSCLNSAMNQPNGPCQSYILQGACVEDTSNPASACAQNNMLCTVQDCSGLSMPSPDLDDAGYALATCLWTNCQSSCQ